MEDMSSKAPNFNRKLRVLLDGRVRAKVARDAEVSPQALALYAGKSVPPPDVAFRLAKALEVDPIWLIDENADFDEAVIDGEVYLGAPSGGRYAVTLASTRSLRDELRDRYVRVAEQVRDLIGEIETIDWGHVRAEVEQATRVESAGRDVQAACAILAELPFLLRGTVEHFDIGFFRARLGREGDVDRGSLHVDALSARVRAVTESLAESEVAAAAFNSWFFDPTEPMRASKVLEPEDTVARTRKAVERYWKVAQRPKSER